MRRLNLVLSLVTIVALPMTGCTRIPPLQGPGTMVEPERTRPDATIPSDAKASGARATQKSVSAKEPNATLIAIDGTRCQVTQKRYRETAIGEKVWCAWQ